MFSQNDYQNLENFHSNNKSEKTYIHLNNVIFEPGETVFYKIYVTNADNSPSQMSEYVYVDVLDSGNKKLETQTYLIENGSAEASFKITELLPSGIYKLKVYTNYQNVISDSNFEKTFFVQKIVAPRVLMNLEFKKKGYGKNEICEADFELKNLENFPIKNFNFKYDVFIAGKKIDSIVSKTDNLGKALIRFKLPENLTSNDGIINVLVNYDSFQESITKSIPINLNFVDLQFLPESGNFIENQNCNIFFIAKNEFGLPLDVTGIIIDENGNKVTNFESFHDGMGKFNLFSIPNKNYFAKITSPFISEIPIILPKPISEGFIINSIDNQENKFRIFASNGVKAKILIRNINEIFKTIEINLTAGWNDFEINKNDLSVGIQNLSLLVDDKIVAEKLIFANFQNGLNIEIKTEKTNYLPREKVKVNIVTKDANGKPIASNLSVSVVDNKLLTYINDKQHDILSWMLLGFEIKGKINEPNYYFDEKNEFQKRLKAIEMLINTQGWRKYNQTDLLSQKYPKTKIDPEKSSSIEGIVLNEKKQPASTKILLFTDYNKVYETKSNQKGYFKFTKTPFIDVAYLVIESKKKKKYLIKNSITEYKDFIKLIDSISKIDLVMNLPIIKTKAKTEVANAENDDLKVNQTSLLSNGNELAESVVVTTGYAKKRMLSASSSIVSYRELANYSNSLNGKLSGIQVQSASYGSSDKIIIRGYSSLYGSRSGSQPLYVVDGIPLVDDENANFLAGLMPDNINTVTVLKDASATAVYGSIGSNGAIIITTKYKNYYNNDTNGTILGKKRHYSFEFIHKFNAKKLSVPESFYMPRYKTIETYYKEDFRNCVYWNSTIHTNNEGLANFTFYNSDENTSFKILAEGISFKGDVGKSSNVFSVSEAFQTDLKVPLYATIGDKIFLPLRLKNNFDKQMKISVSLYLPKEIKSLSDSNDFELQANESKMVYLPIEIMQFGEKLPIRVRFRGEDYRNTIEKEIDVYAKGFPVSIDISGTNDKTETFELKNIMPNSVQAGFKLFNNPFASISDGLKDMLREPGGCFEQVSSSNYPNVMALQLLNQGKLDNDFKAKALGFLKSGYQKLKNYESKDGGFEWYGGNPGHEALTAYGLLQFNEMKEFIEVDKDLETRTVKWLYSRKDDKGGFKLNQGRYGLSHIKYEVNNAYLVYVLSEIGEKSFENEYETAYNEAIKSQDLYRVALCALASFNLNKKDRYNELNEIFSKKINEKKFANIVAEQSIVSSYGKSLSVELVALYALSLLKENKITLQIINALDYINASKTSYGFGSTQATALALKAITTYAKVAKSDKLNGDITLKINDLIIDSSVKDNSGNIDIKNIQNINEGKNNFDLKIKDKGKIPYLFYINYKTLLPQNSELCKVDLSAKLLQSKVKLSETARLEIEFKNKTKNVIFNPIVKIGIPGGTMVEPMQLKELINKQIVDYYEIFGSELVLYFRGLAQSETKKINLDLKAIIPGNYQAVASSAYLYYDNQNKIWNNGLELEIEK